MPFDVVSSGVTARIAGEFLSRLLGGFPLPQLPGSPLTRLSDSTLALGPPAVGRAGLVGDDRLTVFAVSLLVGGLAIYVAARAVVGESDFGNALVTALVGALAWSLLEAVPLLGTALALVAWVAVIKWRYPGGWLRAAAVGLAAWAVAVVALAALALLGVGSLGALGVPGA